MTFDHLHNLVRRFVRAGDTENLAAEIQAEAFEKDLTITYTMIRRRCYDHLRRRRLEEAWLESAQPSPTETEVFDTEYIHQLLERAELSPEEKLVLFKTYWQGQTPSQIALDLGTTATRSSALLDAAKEKLMFAHYRRLGYDPNRRHQTHSQPTRD